MILGIAGGIIFAGLILGAIAKSLLILISCAIAGILLAILTESNKNKKEYIKLSQQLSQYPSYKY